MNKSYSMQKIKYLILFLFLLVCPVQAQTTENYAKTLPDYVYGLGKGVGRALAANCSAALASIDEVKVSQSPDFPKEDDINVKLSVIEYYRFQGDRKKGDPEINFSFRKPRQTRLKPTGAPSDWYLLVNMTEGNKVMVFRCREGENLGSDAFVTTDVAYFGKIKEAIELTKKFRTDYLNVLDYFANDYKSDDELRKGTALNFLMLGPGIPEDVRTYIFVDLLKESPASKQREGFHVTSTIIANLIHYPADAPLEFRRQSFIKLVQIANGENENAMDATEILAHIARANPDELRPFLKSEKTENIGAHLQKMPIHIGDESLPDALTKMLSEQN